LNGREVQESVAFDEIVGEFETVDPERMSRPIIIIEIGIGIDKSGLHFSTDFIPIWAHFQVSFSFLKLFSIATMGEGDKET